MNEWEQEIRQIEEGEAWLDPDEAMDEVGKARRPLDKVVPVRLPAEAWEELRREARELGLGPSTLLRMWTLEKLRAVRKEQRLA